jgi:hypothetical protein
MYLEELFEVKMAWHRTGKKLVRKYRCTSGRRKGRIVAKPAQCFAAPDIKKRFRLKMLKAKLGAKIARKSKRTKRSNPASVMKQKLNKAGKR